MLAVFYCTLQSLEILPEVPRVWLPAVCCPDCRRPNDSDFNFCQQCGYQRRFRSFTSVDKIEFDLPSLQ